MRHFDGDTTEALLNSGFTSASLDKGERYARQGHVRGVGVRANRDRSVTITAAVQGSDPEPYEVTLDISVVDDEPLIEADCTCPVGYNCKHAVAALAKAIEQSPHLLDNVVGYYEEEEEAQVTGRPPGPVAVGPQPMSWEVRSWLDRVAEAGRQARAASSKVILYLLQPAGPGAPHRATVEMVRCTRLKSGAGFGKPQRVQLESVARGTSSSGAELADVALARELMGEEGATWRVGGVRLHGPLGAQVLESMLRTGRCYWETPKGEPLKLGKARQGTLRWQDTATGRQQPVIDVEPAAGTVLSLAPAWYVDLEARTCGPVDCGVRPELAEAWLESPAVAPEAVGEVTAAMAQLGLPAPRAIRVIMRQNVTPVPVLRLQLRRFRPPVYSWGIQPDAEGMVSINTAAVRFDYDGHEVVAGAPGAFVEAVSGDEVVRIARLPRAETTRMAEVLQAGLSHVAQFHYWTANMPEGLGNELVAADLEEWVAFMMEGVPKLKERGWRIEEDPSFEFRFAQAQDWYTDVEAEGNDWFGLELGVVVDGQRVNLLPVLGQVLRMGERMGLKGAVNLPVALRLPDGRVILMPPERFGAIRQTLLELFDPGSLDDQGRLHASRLRAAELVELGKDNWLWCGSKEVQVLGEKLKHFEGIARVAPPEGFHATLRPYQLDGLSWLQFLREYGLAGILADDMGLGKTVQALAHLLVEKHSGRADKPSLVIAPTSLMANWRREAERFAPALKVLVLHGGGRKEHFGKIAEHDLIVTSYALLPRDQEVLLGQEFHQLILDEAQYIKNPRTQWAQIAGKLKTRHRLCMTGTPMENHLGELWSLTNFLMPGFLGSEKQFRQVFRTPIEKHKDAERHAGLARRIRPFVLRRKKEDVVKELPPKTEILRTVELANSQRDLYETIRLAMHERVREEIRARGMARSQIVILDALLKLRQVCCDPRLVKLEAARKVQESAKLELLMDLLPEMVEEGRRVLLFSQFTSMLDLIEPAVRDKKIEFVRLTGETRDRDTPVQAFQSGKVPLFLISLKAGGTGLNLTAADTVIHYDPWWNPAVERQATDRAHRIGQEKHVFVYKLITAGTVEEKIMALQERKKELVEGLMAGAQAGPTLTREELDDLFAPLER